MYKRQVCDHFRSIYGRYLDTFFDLYLKNEEFRQMFENSKDIEQVGTVTIRSAMTDENKAQLDALAKELA